MASPFPFFLSLLFLFSLYTATAGDPPVQDLFPQYGLPKGLLPNCVLNYSISENGKFVVELSSPCYVMYTELVHYDKIVKGKLSYGAVTEASGVQVRKFFIWASITEFAATPDGKNIEFRAGIFSEKLPVSMFAEIPDCNKRISPNLAEA